MILFSYDPKKKKKVVAGYYDEEAQIFTKKVSPKHYMIKEKGYGVSKDVISQLYQLNCKEIHIKTKNKHYHIAFVLVVDLPAKDYGHGKQVFIPVS